jgi:alpha-L-fucosidase
MTLGTQWSWKPDDTIKTVDEVIRILAGCAGGDGNLLLNVGPMPDGRIEPRQIDVLKGVGAWLAGRGESIYGTRGGPFKPGLYGASTRRGNRIYLHVFAWTGPSLRLPPIPVKVVGSRVLGGGAATVRQTESGIEIFAPEEGRHSADTVIVLELDRPASGIVALDVPGQALK